MIEINKTMSSAVKLQKWGSMKKTVIRTFLLFPILGLSSCSTVSTSSSRTPAPLNIILNEVKSELRAVYRDIETDGKKKKVENKKYVLKCNGESTPASVRFETIDLILFVSETNASSLGASTNLNSPPGFTLGSSWNRSRSEGNKITINMAPQLDDIETTSDDNITEGGLSEIFTNTLKQLVAVDEKKPCLKLGYEGKNAVEIQLDFEATDYVEGGTNVNLVLLNIGASGSRSRSRGHRLVAKVSFGEGEVLAH